MDAATLSTIKELGIGIFSVGVVGYILYQVILSLRDEHKKNQEWFVGYVNENNHQKTELIEKVSQNIAQNTEVTRQHTQVLEKLINKMDK